jgi:hypothetical protein
MQLDEWIRLQLAAAPPLSAATRDRLAALLAPPAEFARVDSAA